VVVRDWGCVTRELRLRRRWENDMLLSVHDGNGKRGRIGTPTSRKFGEKWDIL